MKFYFVYQQAFPLGFGLAAVILISLGLVSLIRGKPVVIPFIVSLVTIAAILTPLFLLSLNHFLVAWPLGLGTLLLNGVGLVACPGLLLYLILSRFQTTVIGASSDAVQHSLDLSSKYSQGNRMLSYMPMFAVHYLRINPSQGEASSETRKKIRDTVSTSCPQALISGGLVCLIIGAICAATAWISWCSASGCWGVGSRVFGIF